MSFIEFQYFQVSRQSQTAEYTVELCAVNDKQQVHSLNEGYNLYSVTVIKYIIQYRYYSSNISRTVHRAISLVNYADRASFYDDTACGYKIMYTVCFPCLVAVPTIKYSSCTCMCYDLDKWEQNSV